MAEKTQLFHLMQIAGGTFPSGGFSQSWGLETYVQSGKVKDCETLKEFLRSYLDSTIARCEGPILCEAFRLAAQQDQDALEWLEELSCAVKVTKESRESSLRMGKAFLRIMADILEDEAVRRLRKISGSQGMTYPVVYGVVCSQLGLDLSDSVEAFVFSTVNALVQSAVKLIPLGNTQAQKVLLEVQSEMKQAAQDSLERPAAKISNFCPGMDIGSILHETLSVRLYMS